MLRLRPPIGKLPVNPEQSIFLQAMALTPAVIVPEKLLFVSITSSWGNGTLVVQLAALVNSAPLSVWVAEGVKVIPLFPHLFPELPGMADKSQLFAATSQTSMYAISTLPAVIVLWVHIVSDCNINLLA
jgi:hypothetical protein